MPQTYHVGLIGVGLMGHGIAWNLLSAGHRLAFLQHPGNQPVDDLVALSAMPLESSCDVARDADVVILCVTGSPQVNAVLFDATGVLEGLKPGTVVIDCSTALPSSTSDVARRVSEAGGRFMDAAMTRTPKEAAEGRLNLIVGAPEALFTEMSPLLECFAETICYAGDVGAGHTLKLLHNYVSLGFTAILAEAVIASRRAGIDDGSLLEVLGNGGGDGVILERLRPYIERGDPSGFRFSVANANKDIGYYRAMVQKLGSAKGISDAVGELYASIDDQRVSVPELIRLLNV
ncbi:NAD(P)-dependent oxidoreductase [Marinobacter sp. Arc7-DN-1]|uniref:NAD(P)-dependent oxidoreductase n=1 Tax=Marinobacter sp. Arc7-DN-1 TaxID=2304594 RepID=UPI000E444251|nr:NAD(P)-dependent oxidoreductase [Marinobacter sp. Arc7-DN-1]AXS83328.1 NAD(P)-dependent oxidoreductase [Marinobacter sp. Arc7-DN-1]